MRKALHTYASKSRSLLPHLPPKSKTLHSQFMESHRSVPRSVEKWDDLSQQGAIIALAAHDYANLDREMLAIDQNLSSAYSRFDKKMEKLENLKNLQIKEVEAGYDDTKIDEKEDFRKFVLGFDTGKFPERIELEFSGALDDRTLEDLIEEATEEYRTCKGVIDECTSMAVTIKSKKGKALTELEHLETKFVEILNTVDFEDGLVEISSFSDLAAMKEIIKNNEQNITSVTLNFFIRKKSGPGLRDQLTKLAKVSGPEEKVEEVKWGKPYRLGLDGKFHGIDES